MTSVNCWRDGDFTSGCMRRSRFHLATAASNGVPSWNVTPERRKSVSERPSGAVSQRSASSGLMVKSGLRPTRLL